MKVISNATRLNDLIVKTPTIIAVDLGFSETKKSCGVAISQRGAAIDTMSLTFGELLTFAGDLVKSEAPLLFILEAPLSQSFTKDNNPCARGDFESRHSDGSSDSRLWYSGPGATTALAALTLLNSLDNAEKLGAVSIIEGFASRYGDNKPSHEEVARYLIEDLRKWHKDNSLCSLIDFDQLPTEINIQPICNFLSEVPLVLRLADGLQTNR